MRRAWVVVASAMGLALTSIVTTACGFPDQAEPVPLDGVQLPPDPVPDEPRADAPDDGSIIYLVGEDRLHPVARPAHDSVAEVVESLLDGPRETEVAAGLRSAVPAGTKLLGITSEGGVARVDLSSDFTGVVGEEHLLALAQLVYTVTGAAATDQVDIAIDGESISVARDDGEISTGPVGRADYDELGPP